MDSFQGSVLTGKPPNPWRKEYQASKVMELDFDKFMAWRTWITGLSHRKFWTVREFEMGCPWKSWNWKTIINELTFEGFLKISLNITLMKCKLVEGKDRVGIIIIIF